MSFTVPLNATASTYAGYNAMGEWQGPPTRRWMTLSEHKCDFRAEDPTGANGPLQATSGLVPLLYFNVGTAPGNLKPGHTYYFNFANENCNQSFCDASFSTIWPH